MRSAAPLGALAIAVALGLCAGCAGPEGTPPTAGSGAAAGAAEASAAAETASTPIALEDFRILPAEVTVTPDFVLSVMNAGPSPHNLTIRDASAAVGEATEEVGEGHRTTLAGRLAPGRYVLFCSLPGHEGLGMRATLIVIPEATST